MKDNKSDLSFILPQKLKMKAFLSKLFISPKRSSTTSCSSLENGVKSHSKSRSHDRPVTIHQSTLPPLQYSYVASLCSSPDCTKTKRQDSAGISFQRASMYCTSTPDVRRSPVLNISTPITAYTDCSLLSSPVTQEDIEESRQAQREMYSALKARKLALEEVLHKKTEELKSLCLKEAELTGELPMETPLTPGEPLPQIRRRVGTAFTLSPNIIFKDKETEVGRERMSGNDREWSKKKNDCSI